MTHAPVAPPLSPPGPRNRYPGELLLRFHGAFLGFMAAAVAEYAEQMVVLETRTAHGWRDGAAVDMHEEMLHLTLAVVSKTLFDANADAESDEIGAICSRCCCTPRMPKATVRA
ncbi:hypothetical protein [Gemmatimonas sp.]|jgi:hypothetical protein|uniref:hypothetical protein n=1 Tax=Gemmatimonas sp. TaxID=1962908 RepID=UPI0037BFB3C0